ncbi:unnamed protein product [Vicia faba]|uniref:Phytocyanin domain-containing protein n=1 Tax=Vicia faba TaxID=3906 RepID=A0AAV0ZA79_VICFA|nr:unnamed protein product [Vicia faba]
MGCKNLISLVLIATLITKEVLATQHVVGGSQGWDPSSDFDSWSSSQTFKVGDQLVFKYSSMHSVVELGTRYFACGTLGHCGQGMKVKINIVKGNGSSSSVSSPSSSPSLSSSSPTSTDASSASQYFASLMLIVTLSFVTMISLF